MQLHIRIMTIALIAALMPLIEGCGSSSSGSSENCNPNAVSVNSLDGTSGTTIDANFDYTFSSGVNTATVTTATYFIREAPQLEDGDHLEGQRATVVKATYDENSCDVSQALSATVSCSRSTHCSLDPDSDLTPNSTYLICLTTGIVYETGAAFEGFMARFTTAD